MTFDLWPTTRELLDLLSGEVAESGGSIVNVYDDGERLFARAVLSATREAARGDRLQGGVAVRGTVEEIRVHPYVFRQVCSNGAIFAQAVGTRIVLREDCDFEVQPQVREAIRECCGEEAFASTAEQMRSAKDAGADAILSLMPHLSKFPPGQVVRIVESITSQFSRGQDRSRYGLMNAVTATARETRDPDLRWRLEELGGALPSLGLRSRGPRNGGAAAAVSHRESVVPAGVS